MHKVKNLIEKMRHPLDSPSWKVIDHKWPDFAIEPSCDDHL